MGNGTISKEMEEEDKFMQMVPFTKDIGRMIYLMGKDGRLLR